MMLSRSKKKKKRFEMFKKRWTGVRNRNLCVVCRSPPKRQCFWKCSCKRSPSSCLECILHWCKNSSSCPVCRVEINKVITFKRKVIFNIFFFFFFFFFFFDFIQKEFPPNKLMSGNHILEKLLTNMK